MGSNQTSIYRSQPRRPGPERHIEDAVAERLTELFPRHETLPWRAGSMPIGAGNPDLILAHCRPEVTALRAPKGLASSYLAVLSYLRTVTYARPSTIAERIWIRPRDLATSLDWMESAGILETRGHAVLLPQLWRGILPEVVAVEAKVSDWRRAIGQAARNRVFAHRSLVALPARVAQRVQQEEEWRTTGLGLLAVSQDGAVEVLRRGRRTVPHVWTYYYEVAARAAVSLGEVECGDLRALAK